MWFISLVQCTYIITHKKQYFCTKYLENLNINVQQIQITNFTIQLIQFIKHIIFFFYQFKYKHQMLYKALKHLPLSCQNRKWIVFATRIERGQPAHLCSLTRLYTIGWPTLSSHLNIPKMIMDSSKNIRWIIPFFCKTDIIMSP